MPVRIYDIAKKLGIESKVVLAKAKDLGISAAKVASSTLDKITAEYLEEQMGSLRLPGPAESAPVTVEPVRILIEAPPPPPVEETGAEPEPEPAAEATPPTEPAPVLLPVEATIAPPAPPPPTPSGPVIVEVHTPVPEPPAETPSAPGMPTAPPRTPGLGEKVGFIQLPSSRPAPRMGEKAGFAPSPGRPGARPELGRGRPAGPPGRGPAPPGRPGAGAPGARTGAPAARPLAPPAKPAPPEFVAPAGGELIMLKPPIIVRELADKLKVKPFKLIADLMELGVFANVNQALDEKIAQRIAGKYGFRFEVEKREKGGGIVHAPVRKLDVVDIEDKAEDLRPRAPVVTIMGHVDHGKTSLLDVIRRTNVVAGEAGGITQHIGAYTIQVPHPERAGELQQITFLDTPGHAAFSAMRARGANVTDIVILVVASTEGVMPQTVEALNHARAARVPILVAANKSDLPAADPLRVRQQLQEKGLVCEEWGGETIFVDVSATTKVGIDKLLAMLVLQADVLELKANPTRRAAGNVVESGLEPGGPTATVLVRKGTLKLGDVIVCGPYYGRTRALINEEGQRLKEAGPSVAVKVLGLDGVPEAGLPFSVVENEKAARVLCEEREQLTRHSDRDRRPVMTLEGLLQKLDAAGAKILRVVVKADTQGSVEAIVEALRKNDSAKVSLEIVHSDVGTITESDVVLAAASKGIIVGFHTRLDNGVAAAAKREGVQIKQYEIIYELIDQIRDAMAGLLDPELKDVVLGTAEVRQLFDLSKGGRVAGCMVTGGRIVKGKGRVVRRKEIIHDGIIQTLRRFQDEASEVRAGLECGIRVSSFEEFQVGDVIESYTVEKVAQTL